MPGALRARLSYGKYCKNNFSQKSFFIASGVECLGRLETVLLILAVLETGVQIEGFSGWIWVHNLWGGGVKSFPVLGL